MAKFKVNDLAEVITPTSSKGKLYARILEVTQQTCEAGIEQVSYKARIWQQGAKGEIWHFSAPPAIFCEMELGEKVEKPQ